MLIMVGSFGHFLFGYYNAISERTNGDTLFLMVQAHIRYVERVIACPTTLALSFCRKDHRWTTIVMNRKY